MSEPDSSNIEYRLAGISVIEFAFKEPDKDDSSVKDAKLGFSWQGQHELKDRNLIVICNVIGSRGSETSDRLFSLSVRYVYEFSSTDQFSLENEILTVPGFISIALVDTAYATTRGILFERLGRTSFADIILPIVDPNIIHNRSDAQGGPADSIATTVKTKRRRKN